MEAFVLLVNLMKKIATSHVFCNLIELYDFMRRAQVDDAIDTRPFHIDAKGWGSQTTSKQLTHRHYAIKPGSQYDAGAS